MMMMMMSSSAMASNNSNSTSIVPPSPSTSVVVSTTSTIAATATTMAKPSTKGHGKHGKTAAAASGNGIVVIRTRGNGKKMGIVGRKQNGKQQHQSLPQPLLDRGGGGRISSIGRTAGTRHHHQHIGGGSSQNDREIIGTMPAESALAPSSLLPPTPRPELCQLLQQMGTDVGDSGK